MRKSLIILFCLIYNLVNAQEDLRVNSNRIFDGPGRLLPIVGPAPVKNSDFIDVKGSPFFKDEPLKSTLIANDNSAYINVYFRLNILENRVFALDSLGKEFVVGVPIKQIKFENKSTGRTEYLINGKNLQPARKGWFHLLVNDKVTLMKEITKIYNVHTSYGSAPEYNVETKEIYFVIHNGNEKTIKKANDFIDLLPAKKKNIESHIKSLGKVSKEELLISTALYCNTIL